MQNRTVRKTDGLPRGVYRSGSKLQARVKVGGKWEHLGMFTDPAAASAAVETHLRKAHGGFYRGTEVQL